MCMTRPFFVSHKNDLKNQEICFDFLTYFTVCNAESGVEGTLHRIHPPTAFLALEKKIWNCPFPMRIRTPLTKWLSNVLTKNITILNTKIMVVELLTEYTDNKCKCFLYKAESGKKSVSKRKADLLRNFSAAIYSQRHY